MPGRRRTAIFLAVSLVTGGLAATAAAGPAQAAVTGPIDCPSALPKSQAVEGLTGTGFTVERGTRPDPFTARVLGRVNDGIAPGVDLIMAEISSPALTRAGGIWAGISGSPVYSGDGKLIGSVSYSLTTQTDIAGLTPGADIAKLYSTTSTRSARSAKAARAARTVKAGATARARLVKAGATAKQAAAGFTELAPSTSISGVGNAHPNKNLAKLGKKLGTTVRTGGGVASGAKADGDTISAGGNFAAALSYGDASLTAVGTTTMVCKDTAVAFGHPFLGVGRSNYSAHTASSVLIQPDPTGLSGGPFKLANIGGVVGVVDHDRTTGIRADLGARPTGTFPITSSLSVDGAAPSTGRTVVVDQTTFIGSGATAAGLVADSHLEVAIAKAFEADWGGTAKLTFTLTGTRAGGKPFRLTLTDHFSDQDWLSVAAGYALEDLVDQVLGQAYEPVTITGLDITGTLSPTYRQWRVNNVRVWKGGTWARGLSVSVKAGGPVKLRASVSPYKSEAVKYVYLSVQAPESARGAVGTLGLTAGGGDEFSFFATAAGARAGKFDQLLKTLSTPVGDALTATLDLSPKVTTKIAQVKSLDAPVASYEKDYTVTVR